MGGLTEPGNVGSLFLSVRERLERAYGIGYYAGACLFSLLQGSPFGECGAGRSGGLI